MKRILFVQSSLNGEEGVSTKLGSEFVDALLTAHPGSTVTTLDLDQRYLPHLGADEFQAWGVPPGERTPEQAALAARSDRLIDQLLAHDTLVLGVPMYNLTIPSPLKAWLDRVVRAGRTLRYTGEGPQGLVSGIDAYAVFARGGVYRGTPMDTQTSYLEAILGLIGIAPLNTVFAEGLAMGEEQRRSALDGAREQIALLTGFSTREEPYYASA